MDGESIANPSPQSHLHALFTERNIQQCKKALSEILQIPEELAAFQSQIPMALGSTDPLVRRRCAQALGWLGDEAQPYLPELLKRRNDRSWPVREAMAQALPTVASPDVAAKSLISLTLTDREPLVRSTAAKAAGVLPEKQRKEILHSFKEALSHSYVSVRRRALQAMATIGLTLTEATNLLRPVEEMTADSHLRIRQAATLTLGAMGSAAVPAMPSLVRRLYDREWRVVAAAQTAIGELKALVTQQCREALQLVMVGCDAKEHLERLSKLQGMSEIHQKLQERFTGREDLIQADHQAGKQQEQARRVASFFRLLLEAWNLAP